MKSKTDPIITEAMLSEFARKEADPRWYFNLFGVIASKEPLFFEWMNRQVRNDSLRLATDCPQAFINPVLSQEVGKLLTRAYVRAYFLGLRMYEGSLAGAFTVLQLPNEPKIPSGQEPPLDDPTLEGQVDEDDLEP